VQAVIEHLRCRRPSFAARGVPTVSAVAAFAVEASLRLA